MNDNQPLLFSEEEMQESWREHWKDMPEFVQEDMQPCQQIIVSFETQEDVKAFAELIEQRLTYLTKSVWFPAQDRERPSEFIYTTEHEKHT